ncbi:MAG: hypothetical protein LC643_04595, partial [Bacteroidales bacterium]|nr:hypothetical protein [Bacteroidales bacterium]
MNKQQITATLRHPHHLNEQTLDQMREILNEYPFFQAGRMLWVKNLHLLGHIRYNNELKLAAAHVADRARLFDLLHGPEILSAKEEAEVVHVEVAPVPNQPDIEKPEVLVGKLEDDEVSPSAADDYFGAEEVFETESGAPLNFSRSHEEAQEDEEEEIKYAFPDETENMVLPSAD